jgi:hypothetical protein
MFRLTSQPQRHPHKHIFVGGKNIFGAFAKLRKTIINFVMPVCPHGTTRKPTRRIFMKIWHLRNFRKHAEEIKVSLKSAKKTEYMNVCAYIYIYTYRAFHNVLRDYKHL